MNAQLLAPVVRLECNFVEITDAHTHEAGIHHRAVIEWHFLEYDGPGKRSLLTLATTQ